MASKQAPPGDIHLLPFSGPSASTRTVRSGTVRGGSFVVSMQIDIDLPPEYLMLSMGDKQRIRDLFLGRMKDDEAGKDKTYEKLCLEWSRDPVDLESVQSGQPMSLSDLHEITRRNLRRYNERVWLPGGTDRGRIEPASGDMDGSSGTTQYVWRDGKFVCVHGLTLCEMKPSGPVPWSFAETVGGTEIKSTNIARVSWSIL